MMADREKADTAKRPRFFLRHIVLTLLVCAAIIEPHWSARRANAQGRRQPMPKRPGSELLIPEDAPVRRGQGQRVNVTDSENWVNGLLHAEIGDRRIVILPDGRLKSFPASEAPTTEDRFKPATKGDIVAQLESEGLKGFKSRSTARFVYVYNTSEAFTKGTSRILETMYPAILAYFKRLQVPVHHPDMPLVAVMFKTEEEFRKYEEVPEGIAAYYNSVTNRIVMYEQSNLVELAPELAMKQSIGTIAHEGIHQILHNIGVQQRMSRWPMWLSEGLAEYFAPTSVDQRLRWKGVGMPHDLRMYELAKFLKANPGAPGEIVQKVVAAESLSSSGYAAAWALTHYLAERQQEKFQRYLREVASLGPLEPADRPAAHHTAAFVKHFGEDWPKLQTAMIEHLESLPYVDPIANQTHYVVLLDTTSMRTAGVTTSPAGAQEFQEKILAKLPPNVRATSRFQIMPFANKQLAEQYANRFLGRAN
jgi:hypothetical protein